MAALGLTWVRIGEFAWSRMEPEPGRMDWGWLDRAIDTLGRAGLKVVLGTPTATPPRWMVDRHPDMLAVDRDGRVRGFGSRRHYDFAHQGYRGECAKIVTALAERYGKNPHVAAWQTDNEYACNETTLSYSEAARAGFRDWLAQKYQSPDALNRAWGNVFWSMEYRDFQEIGLPNLTVCEPNPSHVMDFRRFFSDQVVTFNKLQVEIIRRHSSAPVAHNFMGAITEFDHWDVGADLDIASWDSYPLGFLSDRIPAEAEHKRRFVRQGDPDFQAFHHDLYRAVGRGRWWIMEQQPGPVNWAPYNPDPLPGMARLWAWEAFAHGAEAVCYFRWRQAPFAQEQMHAGLLRPDSAPAQAFGEAGQVARELAAMPDVGTARADVALVFDYASDWAWEITAAGPQLQLFLAGVPYLQGPAAAGPERRHPAARYRRSVGLRLVLAPGLFTLSDAAEIGIGRVQGHGAAWPAHQLQDPGLCDPRAPAARPAGAGRAGDPRRKPAARCAGAAGDGRYADATGAKSWKAARRWSRSARMAGLRWCQRANCTTLRVGRMMRP
jgi:beta-galactosidase